MTDWIMIGITAIYVIATICIFIANKKSAKAAEDQLEATKNQVETSKTQFEEQLAETKRQYEETKRLSVMPYFQCEKDNTSNTHFTKRIPLNNNSGSYSHYHDNVLIKNIGLGTAKNIKSQWTVLSGKQEIEPFVFQSAIAGESQSISLNFYVPAEQIAKRNDFNICVDLFFRDLIDNKYTQRIEFKFVQDHDRQALSIQHITYEIKHIIGDQNA